MKRDIAEDEEISLARRPQLNALTGARFIAALIVVWFHFGTRLGTPAPLIKLFDGPAAVAFFFVLSGFVLTYNYDTWFRDRVTAADYLRFLRARIARVYPMHVVALLIATPLTLWAIVARPDTLAGIIGVQTTPDTLVGGWLANLLLVMVYVPRLSFIMPWNPPAWSIAAELFFYVVFPFVIVWFVARLRSQRALVVGFVATYAAELVALVAGALLFGATGPAVPWYRFNLSIYGMPPFRLFEFVIGCLTAALFVQRHTSGRGAHRRGETLLRNALLVASLVVVGTILLLPGATGLAGQWWTIIRGYTLYTVPFAVLVYCLAAGPTFLSPLLESRPMVALGEASYSLYMIHWTALMAWNLGAAAGVPLGRKVTLAIVLGLVGLSLLFHRFVEVPARELIREKRRPATPREQKHVVPAVQGDTS